MQAPDGPKQIPIESHLSNTGMRLPYLHAWHHSGCHEAGTWPCCMPHGGKPPKAAEIIFNLLMIHEQLVARPPCPSPFDCSPYGPILLATHAWNCLLCCTAGCHDKVFCTSIVGGWLHTEAGPYQCHENPALTLLFQGSAADLHACICCAGRSLKSAFNPSAIGYIVLLLVLLPSLVLSAWPLVATHC